VRAETASTSTRSAGVKAGPPRSGLRRGTLITRPKEERHHAIASNVQTSDSRKSVLARAAPKRGPIARLCQPFGPRCGV